MSRTFRRKNYEDTLGSSWDRQGRKTAGVYTKYDSEVESSYEVSRTYVKSVFHPYLGYKYIEVQDTYTRYRYIKVYRAPTKYEYTHDYRNNHGDHGRNHYGPSRDYRQPTVHKNRRQQKHELFKFMKNEDYEPIFESRARDMWWDW